MKQAARHEGPRDSRATQVLGQRVAELSAALKRERQAIAALDHDEVSSASQELGEAAERFRQALTDFARSEESESESARASLRTLLSSVRHEAQANTFLLRDAAQVVNCLLGADPNGGTYDRRARGQRSSRSVTFKAL